MSKKSILFGTIASVIAINSVFADATITTKNYVDTTRQATIPAAETNYEANGGGVSVVTYTGNAGVLGERYICDADAEEDGDCENDYLVTRDVLETATNNLPTTTTTQKVCTEWVSGESHTDANCLLWDLRNAPIRARQCYSSEDCEGYGYSCGGMCEDGICVNGIC